MHSQGDRNLRIALATANRAKVAEISHILCDTGIELIALPELAIGKLPPEDGKSFEENALIKARFVCRASGLVTIADDSGLEVDALGGRPGIYSARYAGGSSLRGCKRLLKELEGVPEQRRTARFRCVIALVTPKGLEKTFEGVLEGRIATTMHGTHGFGYDPLFYLPHIGKTLAELPPEEKNLISHRARALRLLKEYLTEHRQLT